MRLLTTLAASSATMLNEHEFRNINEVQKFLDELQTRKKKTDLLFEKFQASVSVVTASDDDEEDGDQKVRRFSLGPQRDQKVDPANRIRQRPEDLKPNGVRPKIKSVDRKTIEKNFTVLQEYVHQIEILDSLEVRVRGAFTGSPKLPSLLKDIKDRRVELQNSLQEAQTYIHTIATKAIPDEVNNTFRGVVNPTVRGLTGRYKTRGDALHVDAFDSKTDGAVLQFTQYTRLTNLKNDKGFLIKDLYIILTCAIDNQGRHHYYVDTTLKFEPAKRDGLKSHSRGMKFVKPKDGIRMLLTQLRVEDSLDLLDENQSLPLTQKDISIVGLAVKELIQNVKLDEKEGWIRFSLIEAVDSQSKAVNVQKQILADVDGLLHSRRTREKLKTQVGKLSGGRYFVKVWFTGATPRVAEEYRDNATIVHRLKDELGLNPEEVRKFTRILRSRQNEAEDNE